MEEDGATFFRVKVLVMELVLLVKGIEDSTVLLSLMGEHEFIFLMTWIAQSSSSTEHTSSTLTSAQCCPINSIFPWQEFFTKMDFEGEEMVSSLTIKWWMRSSPCSKWDEIVPTFHLLYLNSLTISQSEKTPKMAFDCISWQQKRSRQLYWLRVASLHFLLCCSEVVIHNVIICVGNAKK